jgi:hypothetical protein
MASSKVTKNRKFSPVFSFRFCRFADRLKAAAFSSSRGTTFLVGGLGVHRSRPDAGARSVHSTAIGGKKESFEGFDSAKAQGVSSEQKREINSGLKLE